MAKNSDAKKTQNRGNRHPMTPNQRRAARTPKVPPEADMNMGGKARMADVGRGGGRSGGRGRTNKT